ncbi:MAG: response regulator [Desulfobacterales bacterium]|nr:response regulator [Desulfobacterales bacterium]
MEKIIAWLIGMEEWAGRLYAASADCTAADNPAAARFFSQLSEDEARHAAYLEKALECCLGLETLPETIQLDRATIKRAEAPLQKLEESIARGCPRWENLIANVIETERSEWNDLFLYVVERLKGRCPELVRMAPRVQQHMRYIEKHLATMMPDKDWAAAIRSIPPVWQENILVVEDEPPIAALLETILSRDGAVHTAADGSEALAAIHKDYFAVIVSDVDMPVMDGWQFYQRAVRQFPSLRHRCLFITGDPTTPAAQNLVRDGLQLLAKPFSLTAIRDTVYHLMACNTGADCAANGIG